MGTSPAKAVLSQDAIVAHGYGLTACSDVMVNFIDETHRVGKLPLGLPDTGLEFWFEGEPERGDDGSLVGPLAITMPPGQTGYWRTDQDSDRFVPHPTLADRKVYCVGDIVRLMPDGEFRPVGRSDNQIKLRGHRIELEEIKTVARGAPGVDLAGVAPVRNLEGNVERLVLHVSPRDDLSVDPDSISRHLAQSLPTAMCPSAVIVSPRLTMTETDKIDRLRLAEFDRQIREKDKTAPQAASADD